MSSALPTKLAAVGHADRTKSGRKVAVKQFDTFQNAREEPTFDNLTEEYLANDHLVLLLSEYSEFLGSSKIAFAKDQDQFLAASSKERYWVNFKAALKEKFPLHSAWASEEEWSKMIKSNMQKIMKRLDITNGSDSTYDPKVRALFLTTDAKFLRYNQRTILGWEEEQGSDLKSILSQLIVGASENNNYFERRAIILSIYYGVGRGGEAKFLRYSDGLWDNHFEVLDLLWAQKKTLERTPMTFGCSYYMLEADWFHTFACYFAVDNGLYRTPDTSTAMAKFIFPSLHAINDETVSANVTKWLKECCSDRLKSVTSAKSLRRGGNTWLSVDSNITKEQRIVRGCWAPADTSDKAAYKDVNYALTYPPFCSLAGWPSCATQRLPKAMRIPPEMDPQEADKIATFQKCLYAVSKAKFTESDMTNIIMPFLGACTAAAIMYFPDMIVKYGLENPMNQKMIKALLQTKIAPTIDSAVEEFTKWSKVIRCDFDARNICTANDTSREDPTGMRQLQMLQELHHEIKGLREANTMLLYKYDGVRGELGKLQDLFQHQFVNSSRKRSPPLSNEASAQSNDLEDSNKRVREESYADSKVAPKLKPIQLFPAATSSSNANILLKDILFDMHSNGVLENHINDLAATSGHISVQRENKSYYQGAMQVVNMCLTDEIKQELLAAEKGSVTARDICVRIQQLALIKVSELEGKPIHPANKASILGIGARYTRLQKKTEQAATGTKTITSFFKSVVTNVLSPSRRDK